MNIVHYGCDNDFAEKNQLINAFNIDIEDIVRAKHQQLTTNNLPKPSSFP